MDQQQNPDQPRSFMAVLAEINDGSVVEDASAQLADVTTAALAYGKTGKISIELTVSPVADLGDNALSIKHNIKAIVPQPDKRAAVMFSDDAGNLQRQDPNQGVLDLDGANQKVKRIR